MHSKFHRDKTNGSVFKISGTNFRGPVHRDPRTCQIFEKFQKPPMGNEEKKRIESFIVIRRMEVCLKSRESMVEEGEEQEPSP